MDYLEAKINQLVIEAGGKNKTFVRSFTTRPTKNLANKAGKIFGLIEIEAAHQKIPALIDLVIEEIKNHYYYPAESAAQNELASVSERFEAALKKTNLAIASFLETQQVPLDLEKINVIIALNHQRDTHFTLVGKMEAILFYNLAKNNYRIVNILDSAQIPITTPDPLKLFSQIFSGKIRPRDILLVATSNLFDYFSLEKIKNVMTDDTMLNSLSRLKNLVAETKSKENFALLTMELEKDTLALQKPAFAVQPNYAYNTSQDSIKDLIKTEKETEKLLTPSLMPELKKYFGYFGGTLKNYRYLAVQTILGFYQKQKSRLKKPNLKLPNHFKFKTPLPSVDQLKITARKVSRPLIVPTRLIARQIKGQPLWQKTKLWFSKLFDRYLARYRQLPKTNRVLLILIIMLVLLFGQSVGWLAYKTAREKKIEAVNQIIFDVENKKNEAESSLIYRSENQARRLLMDSQTLLFSTRPILETQKAQITNLNIQIENKLIELRHLTEITEPIQISNLQNLDPEAEIAKWLVLGQKNLYAQNRKNQLIYKVNLDSRLISALPVPSEMGNLSAGVLVSGNEIMFASEAMAFWRLYPQTDQTEKTDLILPQNAKISDLIAYNNRVYLLDPGQNQIYRFNKAGQGWGGKTDWLKDSLDLSQTQSFAIDGSIYLLQADGQIIKTENGQKVDFGPLVIEPMLQGPTKIKTEEGSDFLYILDPPTRRLVVLDKTGNLVIQYTSSGFSELKDFSIIEKDKKAYLLSGSAIFGIPLEHLNK